MMQVCWISLFSLLAIASTGCSAVRVSSEDTLNPTPSAPGESNSISTPSTGMPGIDDDLPTDPSLPIPALTTIEAVIEKAKADLSQKLAIPISQINSLESSKVFWPDSSLGCPESGTSYTQVVVPGYRIILEAQGNQFEYHANIHGHVFYCENPTPPLVETPAAGQP